MPVTFDSIVVGEAYTRPELAEMWGYKAYNAISVGVFTPAGDSKVVLFITKTKQDAQVQYVDHFEGDQLFIEGETNHKSDNRLANSPNSSDELHLFYRDIHHTPFTYFGQVSLLRHELRQDEPSTFVFSTARAEVLDQSAILTEQATHGIVEIFSGDEEGGRRTVQHVRYERSAKNRAEAIRIHGAVCFVCGYDFNAVWGAEFARDFIEVHHKTSITQTSGVVNPAADLVPLCSNCHSMAHRYRGKIISVDELQAILRARRN